MTLSQSVMKILLALCLANRISGHVINDKAKRGLDERPTISFSNKDGEVIVKEQVTVTASEARFDFMREKAYVFDYEQNLLFMKEINRENSPCFVTKLDMKNAGVPYPDEIRERLLEQKEFVMPTANLQIRLQKSRNQEVPHMLPLSKELCKDSDVLVLEAAPVGEPGVSKALAKTTTKKPNSEPGVGWGEVRNTYCGYSWRRF